MVRGRVAITGGTGFLGSHIVGALLASGYEVSCLVRPARPLGWLEGLNVKVVRGDLDAKGPVGSSFEALDELLEGCHTVVHVAGLTRAISEDQFRIVNVLGSAKLAAAAKKSGVRHIIAISSQAAVGPTADVDQSTDDLVDPTLGTARPTLGTAQPTLDMAREVTIRDENQGFGTPKNIADDPRDELRPISAYGRSKAEMEGVMRRIAVPIPCTMLRPPTAYGPRDKDMRALFALAKRGLRVSLNKKSRLSFLYAKNLAQAVACCVERPVAWGGDFMLADGAPLTWAEFTAMIAQAAGRPGLAVSLPPWLLTAAAGAATLLQPFSRKPHLITKDKVLEGRQPLWIADTKKTETILGFHPQWTTAQGVAETYAWYESQGWI